MSGSLADVIAAGDKVVKSPESKLHVDLFWDTARRSAKDLSLLIAEYDDIFVPVVVDNTMMLYNNS